MSEQTYRPKSAEEHRKRGRCCKSSCLHCPYGHTLKKLGLEFVSINSLSNEFRIDPPSQSASDLEVIKHKLKIDYFVSDLDMKALSHEHYHDDDRAHLVTLKNIGCAFIKVDHIIVKDYYLFANFRDQGLDRYVLEAYFFS